MATTQSWTNMGYRIWCSLRPVSARLPNKVMNRTRFDRFGSSHLRWGLRFVRPSVRRAGYDQPFDRLDRDYEDGDGLDGRC